MKKTILIPTDFTIESLNLLKHLLSRKEGNCKYDIILSHGIYLTDSIPGLLFFSKDKLIASLTNPLFEEACAILRNKYASQISSIRKDVFTGFNQAAFNNYIAANKIDEAYIPVNYVLSRVNKKSVDLLPFIRKSALVVNKTTWESGTDLTEQGELSALFFNRLSTE